MTETSASVAFCVPRASKSELALVPRTNGAVADAMDALFSAIPADGIVINQSDLQNMWPEDSLGIAIDGIFVGYREGKNKDKPSTTITMLITEPTSKSVRVIGDKKCVAPLPDGSCMCLVDKRYKLAPEDRTILSNRKGKPIGAKKEWGCVPHGLIRVAQGVLISASVYGALVPTYRELPLEPGAQLTLHGVTFHVDFVKGVLGAEPFVNASKYVVTRSADDNSARLDAALQAATFYPPLHMLSELGKAPAWPSGIDIDESELPAPLLATAGAATTGDDAKKALPSLMDESVPLTKHTAMALQRSNLPIWVVGKHHVILHVNENETEQRTRAASAPLASTPTVLMPPAILPRKDALSYEREVSGSKILCSRALFHLLVNQVCTGTRDKSIHKSLLCCTLPNVAVNSLTGLFGYAPQQLVMRSLVTHWQGAMLLDLKSEDDSAEFDDDSSLSGTSLVPAYCSSIPMAVLPRSIKNGAGFAVSYEFMLKSRLMALSTPGAIKTTGSISKENVYIQRQGSESRPEVVVLTQDARRGFFDEESNELAIDELKAIIAIKDATERTAAAEELGTKMRGGLYRLRETYAFYFVGQYCMTDKVREHQRALEQSDIQALHSGNEQLITTAKVPEEWPAADYAFMIDACKKNPEGWVHYAVYSPKKKLEGGVEEDSKRRG